MDKMLENFRVADDMPIESDLVVQALDKVQQQVEGFYQANRQQVYRLDEVANKHREAIYSRRRDLLFSDDASMSEVWEHAPPLPSPSLAAAVDDSDDEYTNLSFILCFLLFLYIYTPHLNHSTITDHRTQLFTTFALDTLTEIIDASVIADPKKNDKKDLLNGPVDYNKLISKAIQFFPNLKLSEGKSQPSTNEYARLL